MYLEPLPGEAVQYTKGMWQDPFTTYWVAVLEVDGVAYDLGRFGNFVEAGERYLKVKQILGEGEK